MWTSSSNVAYMGVTAHKVDNKFRAHNKCLAVCPVPGSHRADFISSELTEVCCECSVEVRALHVITDSGANVKKAMTQLAIQKWRPCFVQICSWSVAAMRKTIENLVFSPSKDQINATKPARFRNLPDLRDIINCVATGLATNCIASNPARRHIDFELRLALYTL